MAQHKAQRVVYDDGPECSVCGLRVVGEGWSLRHEGEAEPTPPAPADIDYTYREAAISVVRERMKHGGDPAVAAVDALLLAGYLRAKPLRPVEAPTAPVGMDHPATSHAAAAKALPKTGSLRRRVLMLVRSRGPHGATADEVQEVLRKEHQSISPILTGLRKDGWIALLVLGGAPMTRRTRLGNQAEVYVITPHGASTLEVEDREVASAAT